MNFITIGDNVADCYLHTNTYYPGGNAVNVAVNLKKCGAKNVEYIGIFGDDEMAKHIEKSMNNEGIITEKSRKVYAKSGQPAVNIDKSGDRIFVGSPKDTAQHLYSLFLRPEEYEHLSDFDLVHTSYYSLIDHLVEEMAKHSKISYDFSDEFTLDDIKKIGKHLDYAFFSGSDLSEDELEEIIRISHESGTKIVCITLGEKGSICSDGNNIFKQGIEKTKVKDTMGAGDAYIAGFLYKYTETADIKKAMNFAATRGANACKIDGAFGYGKKIK